MKCSLYGEIIFISRLGHIFPFLDSLVFKVSVLYSVLHAVAILYMQRFFSPHKHKHRTSSAYVGYLAQLNTVAQSQQKYKVTGGG